MTTSIDTPPDALATFLEEQEYHGRSERTIDAYARVLRDYANWVRETDGHRELDDVDRRVCMSWVHSLRDEHKASTVASYASYVNRFYNYMVDVGEFTNNPMNLVVDQMDESIESDPIRRDISLVEMRSFLSEIDHPLANAIVMTFLKTGIRVGELCNLDLRDVHLSTEALDVRMPPHRAALEGRPASIYIDSSPQRGHTVNGEERTASNKRERSTIIPIDAELSRALLPWMAIRPTSRSAAEPLFVDTRSSWGDRIQPARVRNRLKSYTEPRGWYSVGADRSENVTPHYFRHFFTTHLRDRVGDRGIVKYLRGDVADDIIDTYTHNWGDRVRRRYESNIYSLTP